MNRTCEKPCMTGEPPPTPGGDEPSRLEATIDTLSVIHDVAGDLERGTPLLTALFRRCECFTHLASRFAGFQSPDYQDVRGLHRLNLAQHIKKPGESATLLWGTLSRLVRDDYSPALPDTLTLFIPLLGDSLEAMAQTDKGGFSCMMR